VVAGTLLNNGKAAGSATTQDAFSGLLLPMPFSPEQITHPENRSNPQPGDPCPTLTGSSGQPPAVAFHARQDSFGEAAVSPPLDTDPHTVGVRQGWRVRRLVPVECERLQGFADGWTDVPYRGRPAADSPRYKALGNSMAVNCMRWIGRRIAAVDALDHRGNPAARSPR
jgi:DNA (cytosine-5)-methyltransferase 1